MKYHKPHRRSNPSISWMAQNKHLIDTAKALHNAPAWNGISKREAKSPKRAINSSRSWRMRGSFVVGRISAN